LVGSDGKIGRVGRYVVGVLAAGGAGVHVGNPASGVPPASIGSIGRRTAVQLAWPDANTVPSAAATVKE
jgi:hypothetical protein